MVKLTGILASILLYASTNLVFGEIETIILQQGEDGYKGCKDTYLIGEEEIPPPQGDAEELVLHGYH